MMNYIQKYKDLMYWDDKGVPAYLLNKVNAVATNDIGTWIVVGGSLYEEAI